MAFNLQRIHAITTPTINPAPQNHQNHTHPHTHTKKNQTAPLDRRRINEPPPSTILLNINNGHPRVLVRDSHLESPETTQTKS
jgi:hypothetical protein